MFSNLNLKQRIYRKILSTSKSLLPSKLTNLLRKFKYLIVEGDYSKSLTIATFIEIVFAFNSESQVIQIGANDGLMCDPLFKFIKKNPKAKFIRIEPLPYYFNKLEKLHENDMNVKLVNCAIVPVEQKKDNMFYFIDPEIANEMDGDGPLNEWAHGLGSFKREIIEETIKFNKFRGEKYRKNIGKFINSIKSMKVEQLTFCKFLEDYKLKKFDLLIIDVQGYEWNILKTISSWPIKPKAIIYEDDGSMTQAHRKSCREKMKKMGYEIFVDNLDTCWLNTKK